MTTCYDVRFAEPYLLLRKIDADIITCPSAFMVRTGQAHWEPLLRARAIETQCYILAAAQIGTHYAATSETGSTTVTRGRESYGEAMIVDPWGTVVARCPATGSHKPAIAYANIDLEYLAKIRREMPVMEQRRYDVYAQV